MGKNLFLQPPKTLVKENLGIQNWPLLVVMAERRDIEVKGAKAPFFLSISKCYSKNSYLNDCVFSNCSRCRS